MLPPGAFVVLPGTVSVEGERLQSARPSRPPYLHGLELHPSNARRVHHGLGSPQCVQDVLPLWWEAHKLAFFGVKGGVDAVLEVLWG